MEIFNIIKDVKSGALPVSEIPSFVKFVAGKHIFILVTLLAAVVFAVALFR